MNWEFELGNGGLAFANQVIAASELEGNLGLVDSICCSRGEPMAQGLNSTKTAARPAHEAIEQNADVTVTSKTERETMDKIGMEAAKRAGNRIHADEEKNPEDSMFTK